MKQAKQLAAKRARPTSVMIWFDGKPVKVRLAENQTVVLRTFNYTDEGYSALTIILYRVFGVIGKTRYENARDCDGKHSSDSHYECMFDQIRAFVPYRREDEKRSRIRYPMWKENYTTQRDFTAEAMGY